MYVCIIFTYTSMCICMNLSMYADIDLYIFTEVCKYICTHEFMYVRMHVYVCDVGILFVYAIDSVFMMLNTF